MGDWIGLGFIVFILACALFGLAHLGKPPKPLTPEEFERRVKTSQGWMSAGVAGGMHALQKLMNPKAAEAVEVLKDLRAGYYDDKQELGEGDEPGTDAEANAQEGAEQASVEQASAEGVSVGNPRPVKTQTDNTEEDDA